MNLCKAAVIERSDGVFEIRNNSHNHPANVRAVLDTTITSRVKAKAVADIFRPASAIVEVLLEEMEDVPCPSFPRPEYITRAANRRCQQLHLADPTDLDFDLDESHIPDGFLRGDISNHGSRHLMFATDQQLQFQGKAKY